jgi:hypothetical protein
VLAFLTDHSFLSALATLVGPLAVFAAPTEEIEHLLMTDDSDEVMVVAVAEALDVDHGGIAEAA